MISLQRSMHSSQMYTPGPAMSFFTCFCDLPQKEHLSRSESPSLLTPCPHPSQVRSVANRVILRTRGGGRQLRLGLSRGEDLVDDSVFLRLLRRHDEVTVGVLLDLLQRLTRVLREDLVQELAV